MHDKGESAPTDSRVKMSNFAELKSYYSRFCIF